MSCFRIFPMWALCLFASWAQAQNYNNPGGTIQTCSGNFYDTGGAGGNYGNNQSIITTICSDTPGVNITITFSSFELEENYDYLRIYDGPTTTSPLIGTYNGTNAPGRITSSSGCLTFRFTSDGSVGKSGWAASIFCGSCTVFGNCSIVPDACTTACHLGTLRAPIVCPAEAVAINVFCLRNVGATPAMPYSALSGCQPSGTASMPSPSADVWYSFIASSNSLDVTVEGLSAPNFGFYEGNNCNSFVGRGCAVGNNGKASATFRALSSGKKYYLRISGADTTDVGDFTLTLKGYNDCQPCLITSTFTASPMPVDGVYQPGQQVKFCFTVTSWSQTSSNWLHAVIPTFGAGWDRASITSISPAVSCDGDGTWAWHNSVTSDATGLVIGPGFFYESRLGCPAACNPNDPGDNFGDDCVGTVSFLFCWEITAANCPPAAHGANLNVSVNTYGDGESGSWSNPACAADPIVAQFANLACCPKPGLRSRSVSCAGGNDGRISANARGVAPFVYNWLDSAGNVIRNVSRNTPDTLTNLSAGKYIIEISDDLQCLTRDTFTITAPPAITANLDATDISCNGLVDGSILSNAAGGLAPYEYSLDGVNFQPANLFSGLSAGTYTITVRDDSACVTIDSATIIEPALLTVALDSVIDAACFASANGAVYVTAAGGTQPYEYAIDAITFQPAGSFSGLVQGGYTITARDSNACTAVLNATILEPLPVSITLDSVISSACITATTGAVYTSVLGGTLPYVFQWSNNASTEDILNLSGDSSYVLSVVDANLCTTTDTFTVPEGAGITLSTIVTDVLCNGNADGSIQVTVTNAAQPLEYFWSNRDSLQTASNLRAGTYSVTVIDDNRCTDTIAAAVNEPALLSLTGTTTPSSCALNSDGAIQLNASGGILPYAYSLDGINFQLADVFNGLLPGNYQAVVRDPNNCTASSSLVVGVQAPFITAVIATDVKCFGGNDGTASVSVPGYASAGFTCRWSTTQTDSAISGLVAGNYFVTVTDSSGCSVYDTAIVSAPSALALTSSTVDVLCNGGNNGSVSVFISGGTPAYRYAWNNARTTATIDSLTMGDYHIVVTDSNNCTITDTFTLFEPAAIALATDSTIVTCNGDSNGVASVTASGGTPPFSYFWDVAANNQGTSSAVNLPAGVYNVTVTDAHQCRDSVSISIPEPAAVTIHRDTVISPLCTGDANGTITVFANGGTGAYSYNWAGNPDYHRAELGGLTAGEYGVTVFDANGCMDSLPAIIVTDPPLLTVAIFPEDTSISFGDSVQLVAVHVPASVEPSYDWQPVGGIAWCVSPCANPVVSPATETVFSLVISDPNTGCIAKATARVGVEHENVIFPPNVFTPDGDGVNEEFEIFFGPTLVSMDYSIFNRWGEKLFQTTNPGDFWDGTYRGKKMNAGVYVYAIKATFLDKEEKFYKGSFTLLR